MTGAIDFSCGTRTGRKTKVANIAETPNMKIQTTFVLTTAIALPMIITALSQTAAKFMKGRKRPTFSFSGREMNIDVP